MPIPIQQASVSDRMRKFFRIRGRTKFSLDETIVPVTMVQDLTKGPYQAGVTPCAGAGELIRTVATVPALLAVLLNNKPGSITERLGKQFDNQSFSVTWVEMQNRTDLEPWTDLRLLLVPRAQVFALGIPDRATSLFSIQDNPGNATVPVEMFAFDDTTTTGSIIWRGLLGSNVNTLGATRQLEPDPNVTITKDVAIVIVQNNANNAIPSTLQVNIRGFYQQQPA